MVFYDDCKIAKSYAIKFKHSVKITYSKTPFFESSRGVARIFEWGHERRRRKKRGAEGAEGVGCGEGVSPSQPGKGSGEGAVTPPQKNLDYLTLKWCILVRI